MKITQIDLLSKDDRGYACEYSQDREGRHLIVCSNAGAVRGRHFHKGLSATKDPEILVLVSGTCVFNWRHIDSQEIATQTVVAPARVEIPPNEWHELIAETDCAIIEFNSHAEHIADTFYTD